jgi:hypothetical protein
MRRVVGFHSRMNFLRQIHRPLGSIAGIFVIAAWGLGQTGTTVPTNPELSVLQARAKSLTPRSSPPAWMDYDKVRMGYRLLEAHEAKVLRVFGTSSLAATFAAKDVAPVLMETGRLSKDFNRRMRETGERMVPMFQPPANRAEFLKKGYAEAVSLGRFHLSFAGVLQENLKWDPKLRTPINGQAYAFVLYTFAWWPIEALIARNELDPVKDAALLEGWFHYWSVMGYGMGAPEDLLPRTYERAKTLVSLLRTAQYAAPGEKRPDGIDVLLGGHVRMISERMAARSKSTLAETTPEAAKALAGQIALSPGLSDALGLGKEPILKLTEYAAKPALK